MLRSLKGAECYGRDPLYWDPDAHGHGKLAGWKICWMCDEAKDICYGCPVLRACYEEALETRESYMIRAGTEWVSGHPKKRNRLRISRV